MINTTRRTLLKSTGALLISIALPACSRDTEIVAALAPEVSGTIGLGNWIKIDASGVVTLSPGKVELGQGIGTALAQITAEALDVDFSRITLAPVDTNYSPDQSYTFSSISIQQSGPQIQKAAAAGKQFLLQQAAKTLNEEISDLTVDDGRIVLRGEETQLSYWEIVNGQDFAVDPEEQHVTTVSTSGKTVGKSEKRIDIPAKVFGEPAFIQDLRLPGMLHARLVRPPAPRAELKAFNADLINTMTGVVKVIRDGNFVAVIAAREQNARDAASALRDSLEWTAPGDLPDSDNIYDWLKSSPKKLEQVAGEPVTQNSSDDSTLIKASYQRPYQTHGSISPSAGVALYEQDKLTVWSHAQGMYPLRQAIAHTVGLEPEQVRCIHLEASGCYGHNGADDAACEAAMLAINTPGVPIRLQWERADEFLWEPYGSAMLIETSAELEADGSISSWDYHLWSCQHSGRPTGVETAGNLLYAQHRENPLPIPPARSIPQPNGGSDRNAVPLYKFDKLSVQKHLVTEMPLRTSSLRGLGAYANIFAIESFMDELALQANIDPLTYRLMHLEDPRAIAVLEELSVLSQWNKRPAENTGVGWGLAFGQFKNLSSYLGLVFQVRVAPEDGTITLDRVVAVCDAGLVINPDGLCAQIEGGINQSASWTLKEQVNFDKNGISSSDWASYPILRFDEIPDIEVHLMPDNNNKALGVGETAQGPAAAAIANAVYHASGQRLRQLPLTAAPFKITS